MEKKAIDRIIVLGIDGLEYRFVEKWGLKNLMQRAYCKTDLSDYDVIVTPPLWGSMITGRIDKDVMKRWRWQARFVNMRARQMKLAERLGRYLPSGPTLWVWHHFVLPLIGGNLFEATANYVTKKNVSNVFQYFEKPWTNGIPGYGRIVSDETARQLLLQALRGDKEPYRKYAIQIYLEDKRSLLSALRRDHDLIFWYTSLLDKIGHVDVGNNLLMLKYYLEINSLAGKVKEMCPDSIIYIISDHGMQPVEPGSKWGIHSDYGFFSSNTGELISKPFHLYDLLLKHAKH